jgi:hypothetical protein
MASRATRATNGVRDSRTVAQSIETGSPYCADDVDDEDGSGACLADLLEGRDRDLGLARGSCMRQPLSDEDEHRERDAQTDEHGRPRDGERHGAIVAGNPSRVGHGSLTRA